MQDSDPPLSALATPTRPAARVALVGTGSIAELAHLPALRALGPRVDLVSVVDTDAGRLADFAARHAIPAARASVDEMLALDRPDLVHLCTPPAAHAPDAVRCLAAGAWVLIEKPPARSLAEYDRIAAAEGPSGPYASVVFQHRFGAAGLRLARLARAGTLGRALVAQCVTAWYRGPAYYEVPWRGRWETEGGGPTMGHGIHQMDLMLAVLGEWDEVRAVTATLDRPVETEDVSAAVVRFASGAVATVLNSVLSPREESYLRFDFTRASVEVRHLYGYRDADWTFTPAPDAAPTGAAAAWADQGTDIPSSHTAQLAHLVGAWERGERPPLSGAEGRAALELITAIYRSAATGLPVRRADLGPHDPFYHRLDGGGASGGDGSGVDLGAAKHAPRLSHDAAAARICVHAAGTELLRYHYRPAIDPFECPAPYFHPLRTLSGGVVTTHRPHDHRWHKGLAMTASHLSGQNFWGGVSYVHGAPNGGYVVLPNVGRLEHDGFAEPDGTGLGFTESVDWVTAAGERVLREERRVRVVDVDPDEGHWTLEFDTALRNVSGRTLEFGSPTVAGRELAGYTGFFWRGPRSFAGGRILAGGGLEGPAVMGRTAPWLGYTGSFDDRDGQATLLFRAAPDTPGGDPHWFVRAEPFAAVNPSLAFFEALELPADETLARRYRLTVADGAWDRAAIEAHLSGRPW
ncbi:PmoA family protein [Actinospica durhamensis]|uniref:PmoA family protein n=1 Tax=Actinospica durhamensis TaxID=1508375 RepID=A0A941EM18_9ACTN|nr:DUF6807 family protein [Actinospica durhamensis]MBR7832848.1 PmoA family protein [Actinospica durhamensis]